MNQTTIIIHRGSHEIGGNCVEIANSQSRLILDVGMPLSEMMADKTSKRSKPDREDLLDRGVIKDIPGLFTSGPKIDGILLSHAHGDHYGLIDFTLPDIPVFLSSGASRMLMAGYFFAGQQKLPTERQTILSPGKPHSIGNFVVTPYFVDHSSYGSLAFLIEVDGKRILYSGDLRLHGRKPGMAKSLLRAGGKVPLDLLIMEGTALSRGKEPGPSEQDVETQLVASMKQTPGLALAMFSPQNVDRLVSFYRAALQTGRTLVLDPYSAYILYLIKSECKVPDPFQEKHIRVFIAESFERSLAGHGLQKLIPRMRKVEISRDAILSEPSRYLMIFRERMYEQIFEGKLPVWSRVFYSYWPGYLDKASLKEIRAQIEASGCQFELAHASGHIHYQDIMEFVRQANPIKIIPIHTTAAGEMMKDFPQCAVDLKDREPYFL